MNSNKRGFTLIELLVVLAMVALLMGAVSTSVASAQNRAKIQRATNDVKVISQAILAYENFGTHELPELGSIGAGGKDCDSTSLGFLLGGQSVGGANGQVSQQLPALLMASLQGDTLRDPWGTAYKVHIKKGNGQIKFTAAAGTLSTGYFLPNFYRLGQGERLVPQ